MQDMVKDVRAQVTIHFKNNTSITLDVSDDTLNNTLINYCTSVDIKEDLYQSSSDNIVGNVCGNTLSLELVSKNRVLIPNNQSSVYYGLMDETAYIAITFTYNDEEDNSIIHTVPMGRYFVDTWEGGTDSSRPNEVSISAVDYFGKLKSIPIDNVRIQRNISFNDYIKSIKNDLNSKVYLPLNIIAEDDDLDIYKNSPYAWQMEYNNFDRSTLEALFNNIAKDCITYIWIDRSGHIKTDHLLDDSSEESVCELSGSKNLLTYNMQTGDIDKYSGVNVKFINNITYAYDSLLSIKNVELFGGEINTFSDRKLNQSTVDDISLIQVVCDGDNSEKGQCLSFDWYKDTITLRVWASEHCNADINVWGTYLIEDYGYITKYKDDSKKDTLIEIENRTLRQELIQTYVDGLINLMSMKNNMVTCQGFINPELNLGDTVHFVGTRFNISDYYKVTGLHFTLNGGTYRCDASLIKVIATEDNIEDILYPYNLALTQALNGLIVDTDTITELSPENEERVEEYIGDFLDSLRELEG